MGSAQWKTIGGLNVGRTANPVIELDLLARLSAGAGEGVVGPTEAPMPSEAMHRQARITFRGTRVGSPVRSAAQTQRRMGNPVRLQVQRRKRDLALFNLAIDSKLRGCDLVRLQAMTFAPAARCGTAPP